MKKIAIVSVFMLFFASSASATIYRWVDDRGVVNLTDDYSNVAPAYRGHVEEIKAPNSIRSPDSVKSTLISQANRTQPPPIGQPLIAEGDFAMKLAEALRIGSPQNEADAESMLTSRGIEPRNGWIADYPMTPDIVGELQNAIGQAADSGKLPMKTDDAIGKFKDLASQEGLMVSADQSQYTEVGTPPDYGSYSNPTVINNYYYDEGPPVVTYYPPPPDYSYLYAWVPYPFLCSGFFFPGFFILHDFDRTVGHFHHGHEFHHRITNHFVDPKTHASQTVDPNTRGARKTPNPSETHTPVLALTHGFKTQEARKGATAIFNRSFEKARSAPATPKSLDQSNKMEMQNRNFQRLEAGAVGSFSTPPSTTSSTPSERVARPFNPPSRSFSVPRTNNQGSVGGFHGGDFGSSPRTFSAPMSGFSSSSSGNRGSSSGFTSGHSFGSSSGGFSHGSSGGSFGHGGDRGRL
jgi:hypothetical protein